MPASRGRPLIALCKRWLRPAISSQSPSDGRLSVGFAVLPLASSLLDRNRMRVAALPHLQSARAANRRARQSRRALSRSRDVCRRRRKAGAADDLFPLRQERAGALLVARQGDPRLSFPKRSCARCSRASRSSPSRRPPSPIPPPSPKSLRRRASAAMRSTGPSMRLAQAASPRRSSMPTTGRSAPSASAAAISIRCIKQQELVRHTAEVISHHLL